MKVSDNMTDKQLRYINRLTVFVRKLVTCSHHLNLRF